MVYILSLKLLTTTSSLLAIMKGVSGFYCHTKRLIRRHLNPLEVHSSEEVASLLG
jgi:hypothetical protein